MGADPIGDSGTGIEHGPFLPPGTPTLNNIFAEAGDSHDDSPMGECLDVVWNIKLMMMYDIFLSFINTFRSSCSACRRLWTS